MSVLEVGIDYETLTADALVAHILRDSAGKNVCLTSSFQTEDMVVLHMLREHLRDVPVIFLETGYHFKELIAYRDRMTSEWGLNLVKSMRQSMGCCILCSPRSAARFARWSR
jgi:phosphoadenosine phosphosulfate reductase